MEGLVTLKISPPNMAARKIKSKPKKKTMGKRSNKRVGKKSLSKVAKKGSKTSHKKGKKSKSKKKVVPTSVNARILPAAQKNLNVWYREKDVEKNFFFYYHHST